MRKVQGGVCAPKGFLAAGAHCGIKIKSLRKDMAIIFSEVPATAAGVFTANKVKASSVTVSKRHLNNNKAQAIIVNSGNANCCTGKAGFKDTEAMARLTANALGISKKNVLVASTGIIGKPMPMGKIINAIPDLVRRLDKFKNTEVALAMMTTDRAHKEAAVRFKIAGKKVTVGAVTKGAGMIHPNMATMLCFITTDAAIDSGALKAVLKNAADKSFNAISVDGDMSTNDMVLIMANGTAGNPKITLRKKAALQKFAKAVDAVCLNLAEKMVRDAEGGTKYITIKVTGAKNAADADTIARAISNSPLVKTAMYGNDPNWGRIAACVGYCGAAAVEEKLAIRLNGYLLLKNGRLQKRYDKKALKRSMSSSDIEIAVDIGLGKAKRTMWASDLSKEYVRINARYST